MGGEEALTAVQMEKRNLVEMGLVGSVHRCHNRKRFVPKFKGNISCNVTSM